MTLNLDYSIAKAKRVLGYRPRVDFRDGIRIALDDLTGKSRRAADSAGGRRLAASLRLGGGDAHLAMHIRQLTAYVVRLPLKRPFHARLGRRATKARTCFVRCELADGTVGWGEGVPRSYVTGETPAGCLEQLAATPVAEQLAADCNSWPDVIRLCERFQPAAVRDDPRGCYGNALRCAVELSILDAFGRLFGEPVSAVTRHFEPAAADSRVAVDVCTTAR